MSEAIENQEVENTDDSVPQGTNPDEQGAPGRHEDDSNDPGNSEVDNGQPSNSEDEQDTFPRSYVEELRDENAKYRQRAQRADDYAQRLHTTLTASTGRLHDASDLEFDQEHLEDAEALTGAIDDLLAKKPHLASRKPTGNIGQGTTASHGTVDLAGLLRSRA